MSDIAPTSTDKQIRSGTVIPRQLAALRRKLLMWMLIDGIGQIAMVLIIVLMFDLAIDWAFHMDIAQRVIMLVLVVGFLGYFAVRRLIQPLKSHVGDDALCLQVESKNREAGQSLISSLQFSRISAVEYQGVSSSLVQATIDAGEHAAEKIDFAAVFDQSRYRINLVRLLASFLLLAAIAIGISTNETLSIWANRNLILGNMTWPQSTYLEIEGLNEAGEIVVLRGEDHRQIVNVTAESEKQDVDVFIEFRESGNRSSQKMQPTGNEEGREFELVFRNVTSEFAFRATGGDAKTDWVPLKIVPPPEVSQLQLTVHPPAYTEESSYELPTGTGPYSLLQGSRLTVEGSANKDLNAASLSGGEETWELPLVNKRDFRLEIPTESLLAGKYVFSLTDSNNRTASRPHSFSITLKKDRAPKVRAALNGISGMIVSRAIIPFDVSVIDDYKISDFKLSYNWRGDAETSTEQQADVGFDEVTAQLGKDYLDYASQYDLEPLQIPAGAGLKIHFAAADNDVITGPKVGKSNEFLLRVVTEEELRTDLLRREKEQRQELEHALKRQEDLQTESQAMLAGLSDADSTETANTRRGALMRHKQQQKSIATTIGSVAMTLQSYLTESLNNRLDDDRGRLQERLGTRIIGPLRDLDEIQIQLALRYFDSSRRNIEDDDQLAESLKQTIDQQVIIVEKIKLVLRFMAKEESYQEMVNLLYEIEKRQKNVLDMTNKKNEEQIKKIFENGGFDLEKLQ